TVVTSDGKGNLLLAADPRASDGRNGHVVVTAVSHPDVHAEMDVPVRYDVNFVADFSGAPGADGSSGLDGRTGSSGSMGSIDANNPSPGGAGENGTDGSDGKDGDSGGDAPRVDVSLTLRDVGHPLLEAEVRSGNNEKFYLVDPQGGTLTVKADGGKGGSG